MLLSPSTITNSGSIVGGAGYFGDGVHLTQGGNVTNLAGGTITADGNGIYLNMPGNVSNAGDVSGTTFGIGLSFGGSVSNTGNVSGGAAGIEGFGPATITNSGNVTVTAFGAGVQLSAGGAINNKAGGYIGGGTYGAQIAGGAGEVMNAGSITGKYVGLELSGGGNVTNLAGGNITGTGGLGAFKGAGGVGIYLNGASGNVGNGGTISGTGYGVFLAAGGNVTNLAGGAITGTGGLGYGPIGYNSVRNGGIGVFGVGAATYVTNTGSIYGVLYGVRLDAGGTVTNNLGGNISGAQGVRLKGGGTVVNYGTILGLNIGATNAYGVAAYNAPAFVTNGGNISGYQLYGVSLHAGGAVNNKTSGYISGIYVTGGTGNVTNAGSIAGYRFGVRFGGYGTGPISATLTNTGTITSGPTYAAVFGYSGNTTVQVTNSGSIAGGIVAVYLQGNGTVTNLVGGNITSADDAVRFGGIGGETIGGTLTNSGRVAGAIIGVDSFDIHVTLNVSNQSGGLILGGKDGVLAHGPAAVANAGSISGGTYGVRLTAGGNVTNQAGGVIAGTSKAGGIGPNKFGSTGVAITGAAGVVTNGGVITGYGFGVYLGKGGSVTNQTGGNISATAKNFGPGPNGRHAVAVYSSGAAATVTNAGTIAGTYLFSYGVDLTGGGNVTNTGLITGGIAGVQVLGPGGVITNQVGGNITAIALAVADTGGAVSNAGVINGDGGVLMGGGGTVSNSGNINAFGTGIQLYGNAATGAGVVTNSGNITSTAPAGVGIVGVQVRGPGTVTNSGTISGFQLGVYLQRDFVDSATSSVTNQATGLISGTTVGVFTNAPNAAVNNAGTILGAGNATFGVEVTAGGNVTNSGTISGGSAGVLLTAGGNVTDTGVISGGKASVMFTGNGTTNTLTLGTGALLNGPAVGSTGAGATNALVLTGHGTANNAFLNFQTLAVNAGGIWALNGVNTIGATSVNSGNLQVGDAGHPGTDLISAVTVNAGGTLSGHGMVTGNVIDNGGTISPGGTIGVLTITGNLSLSGTSTTDIEIAPPSMSSLLMVGGTASLGGTADFLADAGVYRKGEQFHFLTAGAISGNFSSVVVSNGLPGSITLTSTTGTLTLLAGNFAATGGTPNENAIAAAVNDIPVGAGDFDAVANPLIALGGGAAQNHALDELGGEIYADTLTVGRQSTRGFLGMLDERLDGADAGQAGGPAGNVSGDPAVWGRALGRFDRASGDGNAHGFNANAGGLAFGVSAGWGPATVGAALSWDETDLSLSGLPQSGRVDETQIAAYGEARFGGMFFANGAVSAGWTSGHGERAIVFSSVNRHASGDFDGTSVGFAANIGARMPISQGWIAEPSVGVVYSSVRQGDVRESGAGSADLFVAGRTQSLTESVVGVRFKNAVPIAPGLLTADIRFAWTHDFQGVTPPVAESFPVTPGATLVLKGANTGEDAGVIGAGLSLAASSSLSLFARYDAAFADNDTQQTIDAGLKFRW